MWAVGAPPSLWRTRVGNKKGIERGEDKRQQRKGDEGEKEGKKGRMLSRREDGKQEQDEKVKQENEKL